MRREVRLPGRGRFEVNGDRFSAALKRQVVARCALAAKFLQDRVMRNISRQGYGRPSRPGEFPRMQTAKLRKSLGIRPAPDGLGYRLYALAFYAPFLEYGPVRGRSFLRRTLAERRADIGRIIGRKG
jgi:hypothetical protein